jgi:hypothetical protein
MMATKTDPEIERLYIREQVMRIDKMQAELSKIQQDIKLATPQTFFNGALAMAALIGAGAALAKLFFPG